MTGDLPAVVAAVAGARDDVRWSICVRDAGGAVLAGAAEDEQLPTASVGKLLLLLEVARRCEEEPALAATTVSRSAVEPIGEAGLWQHLLVDRLPVADAAVLVSAFSDNLATNVLLDLVGLPAVTRLGHALGLARTQLLDAVRPERRPGVDPPHLSVGSAAELSAVMVRMAARDLVSPAVSEQLERWLATDADLSMVAAGFGLDPLAHVEPDGGLLLRHKTGADAGTKADVGLLRGERSAVGYAAIAHWDGARPEVRPAVAEGMRRLGEALLDHVR